MAPHKSTRSTSFGSSNNVSFSSRGKEAENVESIVCTPKYITLCELRKPAVVTDRLRRDYQDLKSFDRVSMKAGVRKILNTSEVIKAVNSYWNGGLDNMSNAVQSNNDDDSLVSTISAT